MAVSAIRKAPLAALLMLGAIAAPAQAGWFDFDSKPAAKVDGKSDAKADTKSVTKADDKTPPLAAVTLDDSIQQAHLLRLAGAYPEAIKHLSQLMMVASDDPRVIAEYGKTLASMGRAADAVNFLTRAQQLQPNDWTVYSALGVAYDQTSDHNSAQANYEQALKLKPEEPSVLSNYALSRMLAKDPDMARKLAARAEKAGGAGDAIINRNIAMVLALAPESAAPQVAQAPAPAPQAPVAVASLPPVPAAAPVTNTAPKAPVAVASVQPTVPAPVSVTNTVPKAPVAVASTQPVAPSENRVVMQKVPVDPLAGPVAAKPVTAPVVATAAPRPLQVKPAEAPLVPAPVTTAELKPVEAPVVNLVAPPMADKVAMPAFKIAEPTAAAPVATAKATAPATPAATPVATAKATVPAPVKAADAKPVTTTPVAAPVATAKATVPAPVKAAEAKPVPAAASVTVKMTAPAPVKAAGNPEAAPKVLASTTQAKTAEAKPVVKTVAQPKDAIPGLRLSANAY